MQLWESIRKLRVGEYLEVLKTGYLRLAYGAVIKYEATRNTVVTLTADMLETLRVNYASLFIPTAQATPTVLTTATTLAATDNGRTFYLNAAAGFAVTLPAPVAGYRFRVIVKAAPTGGNYTIVTTSGDDLMVVSVNELETDTGDDGPWDDNADTITLVQNVSVAGDWVDIDCDGTKWYVKGQVSADGALTTATT